MVRPDGQVAGNTHRLAIVTWGPPWHHPRLYPSIARSGRIDLTAYFLSRGALDGKLIDDAFSTSGRVWAIDVLGGYRHEFLKNRAPRKAKFNLTRVGAHVNPSVVPALTRGGYDALLLEGWNDVTFWLAGATARWLGIPYLVCGDATILAETDKPLPRRIARRIFLQRWFFAGASGVLYRFELNRRFYESCGVPAEKTFFYPFPVDLDAYRPLDRQYRCERNHLRETLGILPDAFAILFVGRFAPEKRVFDLIRAYSRLDVPHKQLFLVGDGPLRSQLEAAISAEGASGIRLTGFLQRDQVLRYYAACDALVIPSSHDPHPDVVRESMCFGTPPVISDRVGSAYDLVSDGWNGFVYRCGCEDQLAHRLAMLAAEEPMRLALGERCRQAVEGWGYEAAVKGVISALDSVRRAKAPGAGY